MKKRKGRPTRLSRLSAAQIMSELARRQGLLEDLRSKREALAQELTMLDGHIAELEPISATAGSQSWPSGARRGRRGNKQPLQVVLQSLLRGRTLNAAEMAAAAIGRGYKSTSKNFRQVVSLAILKHRKLFKRVGRGRYTAK